MQITIYKIKCLDENIQNVYIGKTKNFNKRKWSHKQDCCNPESKKHNLKLYQFIRANGGWDNWIFEQLAIYNCENDLQASEKEREHFDQNNNLLNSNVPNQTKKQWEEVNKETRLRQMKEYRDEHQDETIQKYNENRDYHINRVKQYRLKNLEKKKEKTLCECGGKYTHENKSRHLKCPKHLNYINK